MQYAVGQTLWFVPSGYGMPKTPQEITISKVGRKWAEFKLYSHQTYRADIATDVVDGGKYSSPGSLWESKKDWEEYVALKAAWGTLGHVVSHTHPPDGVTLADIEQARKLLKLPPK